MAYLLEHLLTRSARHHPDREAVVFKGKVMTYRELDASSNRLARALQNGGIATGDRVGIYLNKSLESVVAVFGILKAGGVYVPLDPAAPVNRVAFILGNCAMKGLVTTQKRLANLRPALTQPSPLQRVVFTDDADVPADIGSVPSAISWRQVQGLPNAPLVESTAIEDDLAYILYTSGSTGEPKGVMISHRASLTFVDWACATFDVQPTDHLSNHAPLHFDLSVFDIFAAIKAGAAVHPVPEEMSVFPIEVAKFIEAQRISIWYSVPSLLTRLVLHAELDKRLFPQLRTVLFAGEVFAVKYLRKLMALVPQAQYYNLYGPTETNVCTYYHVQSIPPDSEPIPIGKACANTHVFAVCEEGDRAAADDVHELYVRGPCLMKGYWGLADKTRQVLVRHPSPTTPYADTVYRTGDLVRQDAEGNYLFLGRRDNQIKSRGYRIELGEIESVLYRHAKVEEVAAIAIPDEEIGNTIKAVVVTKDRVALPRHELDSFCAKHLPKYMVPACIEFRDALPKTSTGKIDRTTLAREHRQILST
jgi:amino acid adenylation domain-containing protein